MHTSRFFDYTVYSFDQTRVQIGISFKASPSLSLKELRELIDDLNTVAREANEARAVEPTRKPQGSDTDSRVNAHISYSDY